MGGTADIDRPPAPIASEAYDPQRKYRDPSFDHLVGKLLEMHWHVEAERLGSLEVDHQLELNRGLHGKLARFRALEDAVGIRRRPAKIVGEVSPVSQQTTELGEGPVRKDGRDPI